MKNDILSIIICGVIEINANGEKGFARTGPAGERLRRTGLFRAFRTKQKGVKQIFLEPGG